MYDTILTSHRRRTLRALGVGVVGLVALAQLACSGVPPPETVNRDQAGANPGPNGGGQPGWGGGAQTGPGAMGWGASENDVVIEQRYVQGVQVGVPVGPLGGKPGDCNCRAPESTGGVYNDPESANYGAAQPTHRDGTPAAFEGEEGDLLEGSAAWFGAEMNDTPTTSGADRNQWGVFASHPTLPYGTEVEVTNLKNKRKMRLVINDRTGVGGKRVLLISEGAATNLDMKRDGVAQVKLKVTGRR